MPLDLQLDKFLELVHMFYSFTRLSFPKSTIQAITQIVLYKNSWPA